ncbi:MAG: HAD family hydrolase [Candidatus Micrarchaeota archaeon]
MTKIVLWDFDGVLADTLEECYEITRATISHNLGRIAAELQAPLSSYPFEEFAGDRPVAVNAADFFAHFLSRRKYGLVDGKHLEMARKDFADLIVFLDGEYYRQRAAFAERLGKEYYEMLAPYPGVLEAVRGLRCAGVLQAVMSARDEQSVNGWLKHYGVEDCFDLVVGTEVSRADRLVKQKQIALVKERFGAGVYFFVDDLAHNLEAVHAADASIKLVFAVWGYGKAVPPHAIPVHSPQDAVTLLESAVANY